MSRSMPEPSSRDRAKKRPFRLIDSMVLVAATAVAFAIFRQGLSGQVAFNTFGGTWEQWLFFWMHQVVPFPAMWSLAVFAIAVFDRDPARRRKPRHAGVVACSAAVVALALTALIASAFYTLHILEETGTIPRIFSHGRNAHAMPPFANAPMEEIVGAAVLGAWSAMAASGRWRCQPSWIDRAGRVLGLSWIGLFLIYLYASRADECPAGITSRGNCRTWCRSGSDPSPGRRRERRGSFISMTDIDRVRDQIERAFDGDPWCGPSLMSVLGEITSDLAARRVPGLSHSIWEIVLHVSAWQATVGRRIAGEPVATPEEGDWPPVHDTGDAGWQAALRGLGDSHRLLLRALDSLDESHLDRMVGDSADPAMGSGMTAYANLHGIAQHAMYHAGQVAILKKLAGGD